MKKILALIAATGLTVSSLSALQHTFNSQKVTLDQLPPAAQKAIKEHAGNAPIEDIDMETFDGLTSYQAAFNKSGKHEEVRVDARGHGLAKNWRTIPPAVEKTADKRIGNAKITGFYKGLVNGEPVYHFRYDQSGTPADLWLSGSGSVIKQPAGSPVMDAAGATPSADIINNSAGAAGANATTAGQTTVNQPTAAGGTRVDFKDLPWTVQKSIMAQAGGTSVQHVYKTQRSDGQIVYHARFEKNGQTTRLAVGQDGSILNSVSGAGAAIAPEQGNATTTPLSGASKVSFNDLPAAAKNAITAQANGAAIEDIDKGTVNGQTVYEAAFKKEGKTYELQVKDDGTVLGGHFD